MITEQQLIDNGFIEYEIKTEDLSLTPYWLREQIFINGVKLNQCIGIDLKNKNFFLFHIPMPTRYTGLPVEHPAKIIHWLKFPENMEGLMKIYSLLKENIS